MKKVQFGRTGLQVSQLGFGAAPIGYLNTAREKVRTILNLLLDRGVNVIDTAASYEGSGEAIGALVEAQKAGKVRFAGYSGDNEAAAWAAARPEIFVIETSVSVADQM